MIDKIYIFLFISQLYEAKIEIYNLDDSFYNEKLPYFTPTKTTNQKITATSIHQTKFSGQNFSIFSQFVVQLRTTPSSIDLRKQNAKDPALENTKDDFKRVCIFPNWAAIRDSPISRIAPEDIDPFLCTHIHYTYANIDVQNFRIVPSLRQDTSTSEIGEALYLRIMRLKVKNPKLKILISIGGWNAKSTPFNRILANDFTLSQFVANAINFMRQWKFDGLDIQWEYPGDVESGATFDSKQKFTQLLKNLRTAIEEDQKRSFRKFYLSAFLSSNEGIIRNGYDLSLVCKYLDYAAVETYDYASPFDGKTGYNAPLYSRSNDKFNINSTISFLIENGCPAKKLLLGIPTYARAFSVPKKSENGVSIIHLGVLTKSDSIPSHYTDEDGIFSYYEVCELMTEKNAKIYWDDISMVPFAVINSYSDQTNLWISYEDIKSARRKADYVKRNDLGGVAIFSLDMDDFKAKFCNLGPFPIIDAIRTEFDKAAVLNPDEKLDPRQKITTKFGQKLNKPERKSSKTYIQDNFNSTKRITQASKEENITTRLSKNQDEIFEILKKFKGVRQFNIITKLDHFKNSSLKQSTLLKLKTILFLYLIIVL